jgi:AcrR family transcriptional regulator
MSQGPTGMGIAYRRAVDALPDPGSGPGTPPTMTVREELREVTRQRLLSAAEEIFQRDGYSGTTVGSIATSAHVSRATFYLHFTDKFDVLMTLMRTNLAETPDYWHEVDAALVSGARSALRASLGNTLNWYEQHANLLRPLREALAANRHLAQRTGANFAGFADEMSGYLARVPPQDRDRAHLRLQLLMIQLDQLAYRIVVLGRESIDRELMLDEVTDIWRLALPGAGQPS